MFIIEPPPPPPPPKFAVAWKQDEAITSAGDPRQYGCGTHGQRRPPTVHRLERRYSKGRGEVETGTESQEADNTKVKDIVRFKKPRSPGKRPIKLRFTMEEPKGASIIALGTDAAGFTGQNKTSPDICCGKCGHVLAS